MFILLAAGVSQVPACYATKLDCSYRDVTGCSMVKTGHMAKSESSTTCCLKGQAIEKQKATDSYPLDRLKRLKIDQIQHDATLLPPFGPELVTSITLEQTATRPAAYLVVHKFGNPHYSPLRSLSSTSHSLFDTVFP